MGRREAQRAEAQRRARVRKDMNQDVAPRGAPSPRTDPRVRKSAKPRTILRRENEAARPVAGYADCRKSVRNTSGLTACLPYSPNVVPDIGLRRNLPFMRAVVRGSGGVMTSAIE